ncbi:MULTISPECIES: hypothetical protein [unclassified Ligilactobacillus]|uniref:hypothetical protein n=1 Tax=unclassified Ligilactobacillus TaxID=2767920 RepID=UPI0038522DA4
MRLRGSAAFTLVETIITLLVVAVIGTSAGVTIRWLGTQERFLQPTVLTWHSFCRLLTDDRFRFKVDRVMTHELHLISLEDHQRYDFEWRGNEIRMYRLGHGYMPILRNVTAFKTVAHPPIIQLDAMVDHRHYQATLYMRE